MCSEEFILKVCIYMYNDDVTSTPCLIIQYKPSCHLQGKLLYSTIIEYVDIASNSTPYMIDLVNSLNCGVTYAH